MCVRITTFRLKPEYDNEENLRKIQVELAEKPEIEEYGQNVPTHI